MAKSGASLMERIRCQKWSLPSVSRIHWDSSKPRILFILTTVIVIGVLHKTFSDSVAVSRIDALRPVLKDMNAFMENATAGSQVKQCKASLVKLEGYEGVKTPNDVVGALDQETAKLGGPDAPQTFIKTTIPTAPCG